MVLVQALHLPGHSTIAKQKASEGTDSNADACKTLPHVIWPWNTWKMYGHLSMAPLDVKSLTKGCGYSLL